MLLADRSPASLFVRALRLRETDPGEHRVRRLRVLARGHRPGTMLLASLVRIFLPCRPVSRTRLELAPFAPQ
jgi:hypothetical protein